MTRSTVRKLFSVAILVTGAASAQTPPEEACQNEYAIDKDDCGSSSYCQSVAAAEYAQCDCEARFEGWPEEWPDLCNYVFDVNEFLKEPQLGGPVLIEYNVEHSGSTSESFYLTILNGADGATWRASAASIKVNGDTIFDASEIDSDVSWDDKQITLDPGDNSLKIGNSTEDAAWLSS